MPDLKERLQRGDHLLGTMLSELASPNLPRMLSVGGFEYLIVDCEHGYFSYPEVAALAAVCNGIGMPIVIRIPEVRREIITKFLDMGVDGLLVPMTGDRATMEQVVRCAKYAPLGERGLSTQRAHTNYAPPPLGEYMAAANRRTVLFAQIETREGVRNIDDILSLDGVDAALIGPNDMACDCGTPGDFGTPEMKANIAAVIAAGRRAGKPTGIISGNIPFLKDCRAQGMTVLSCNSEVGMIISGAKRTVRDLSE